MKLKDFELTEDNHFVAMEYYMLILNRTYLVLITDDLLIGILANGLVSAEGGNPGITRQISRSLAIQDDLTNPHSYIKEKYIRKVEDDDLYDGSILTRSRSNFIINRKDIAEAYYDPKKKWGMGYYPHDGKVYVLTNRNKKREFIILGDQSGQKIANLVSNKRGTKW